MILEGHVEPRSSSPKYAEQPGLKAEQETRVKQRDLGFHPRDDMLVRVLAMALCLSVCLSVTSRSSIETGERIELVFGTGASFDISYTVL